MATNYWLTFRIDIQKIGVRTSTERRTALYKTITDLSTARWLEPTSFILFTSKSSLAAIAVACKKAIAPSVDLVLIRMVDVQDAVVIGKVTNITMLRAYMSYLSEA